MHLDGRILPLTRKSFIYDTRAVPRSPHEGSTMKHSAERILTTHVGSLPRPDDLMAMMQAKAEGKSVDETAYAATLRRAVADSVRRPVETGLDVVSDGEMGKSSFITYVSERLGGMERRPGERPSPFAASRETASFPEFYQAGQAAQVTAVCRRIRIVCAGPVSYQGHAALRTELANLKSAMAGQPIAEAFVPAIAPSNVETTYPNEHYPTVEAYLFALADAMREEYKAIVDAGFLLQLDDPRVVTQYGMPDPAPSIVDYRKFAELRVEAINHALAGIPSDRVRYHLCWGSWHGPHVTDVPLKDIVDIVLRVHTDAYSVEAANPRHEHEWQVWEDVKLPDGKILIP